MELFAFMKTQRIRHLRRRQGVPPREGEVVLSRGLPLCMVRFSNDSFPLLFRNSLACGSCQADLACDFRAVKAPVCVLSFPLQFDFLRFLVISFLA